MTANARIRPARSADAPAITALTRKAYGPWIAVTGREPLPMQVDYAAAIRAHAFFLCEDGDALVGLIEMATEDDGLLVVNVAVDPDRQGSGVGRRLMAHAEAFAAAQGLARIRLFTNALFVRNLRFYAALGYATDREEAMNGGVAAHMSKSIR